MSAPELSWVTAAAQRLIRYPWQTWWYGDSVGFEGLIAASDLTGDERFQDFAYGMTKGWLGRRRPRRSDPPPPFHWSDHTAPAAAMTDLAVRFEDDELVSELLALADWQLARPRADGLPLLDLGQATCVWVDCMQFQGPFLSRLAEVTGERKYYDAAVWFLLGHDRVLRDTSGLYSHVYDVTTRTANGVHWGRGQGWAMLGLWQTLAHLPPDLPEVSTIRSRLCELVVAMVARQTPAGTWRTIVDDAAAYEESSTTAFFLATALPAAAAGALDHTVPEPALARAVGAYLDAVDVDGLYRGVSANTHAGAAEHYRRISRDVTVPWGHGPALLAAKALSDLGAGREARTGRERGDAETGPTNPVTRQGASR